MTDHAVGTWTRKKIYMEEIKLIYSSLYKRHKKVQNIWVGNGLSFLRFPSCSLTKERICAKMSDSKENVNDHKSATEGMWETDYLETTIRWIKVNPWSPVTEQVGGEEGMFP